MSSVPDHSHIETTDRAEHPLGTENSLQTTDDPEHDNAALFSEPTTGHLSSKSSSTQVGLMSNTKEFDSKQEDRSRECLDGPCDPPSPVETVANHEPPARSTLKSILLTATCTVAMVLNVRSLTTYQILSNLEFADVVINCCFNIITSRRPRLWCSGR